MIYNKKKQFYYSIDNFCIRFRKKNVLIFCKDVFIYYIC